MCLRILFDFKSLHNLTMHSLLSGTSQFFQAISSSSPSPTSMALAYSSADCHFHIFIAPVTKPHCDRHRSTKLCPQGKRVCFLMMLFILFISAKKKKMLFSFWQVKLWVMIVKRWISQDLFLSLLFLLLLPTSGRVWLMNDCVDVGLPEMKDWLPH